MVGTEELDTEDTRYICSSCVQVLENNVRVTG